MDGKIIDALFGLLDEGIAEDLPGEFLSFAVYFFQSLIDGYGTDRHRRVTQNPLSRLMDVLTGGQVHYRVSSPACRPDHLFHFFFDRRGNGGVANISVNLHQEIATDNHRLEFWVVNVGRNDSASPGDLVPHKFWCNDWRNTGSPGVAAMLLRQARVAVLLTIRLRQLVRLIFTDGDILHLRRNNAFAGVVHLRDIATGQGASRPTE